MGTSLLNKDALRQMREEEAEVELGTVNFRVEKALMQRFSEAKKEMTARNMKPYPREEILRKTFELLTEVMEEDLKAKK